MNPIATAIKAIIEGQGLTYFRSVNINDLNQQVGETDLAAGVGVYSSLPSIEALMFLGGTVVENTDIEVFYLELNPEVDDKGEAIDVILDALKPLAVEFIDKIRKDTTIISSTSTIDDYQLDAIETLKMTKEVMTGWRIRMALPIDRKAYFCA